MTQREDISQRSNDALWKAIRGSTRKDGGDSRIDGLLRALCWGNSPAWGGMAALIELIRRQEERIAELERKL